MSRRTVKCSESFCFNPSSSTGVAAVVPGVGSMLAAAAAARFLLRFDLIAMFFGLMNDSCLSDKSANARWGEIEAR